MDNLSPIYNQPHTTCAQQQQETHLSYLTASQHSSDSSMHRKLPQISSLRSEIESIVFISDAAVPAAAIATATGSTTSEVEQLLAEIATEFSARGSGIELRCTRQGWRFYTATSNAEVVEKFILAGAHTRLSKPALETLAVIAYRQPVTRAQVAAVRGVNVDGVIRTLLQRGLIVEVDQIEKNGAHRYATTELFLELLGIDNVNQLPELAPFLPDIDHIDEYSDS